MLISVGGALRKARDRDLFIPVAQTAGAIDDMHPFGLCTGEDVGGVEKRRIHRWVLAHQHDIQLAQRRHGGLAQREPIDGVIGDPQRAATADRLAVAHGQIGDFEVGQGVAAPLRLQQHRQGRVLGRLDAGDGVHHHA